MKYFPHLVDEFREVVDSIGSRRALVVGHARPDGDCIGSQIALTRMLRQNGFGAAAFNSDPVPGNLSFLVQGTAVEPLTATSLDGSPIIFVDCADEQRVGVEAASYMSDSCFLANIDHHISNTEYAQRNLIESSSAATCEILAGLAFDVGWHVDEISAQALLTGIMTDTGRYSFVGTSSRVFELSSRLVDCGAAPHRTARSLYENESFARLKLLQRFLGTLRVEFNGKLGMGKLRLQDFADTGGSYEDTEGFVDYARAVRGASMGLYLEERPTNVKVSLRAENAECRVDLIAAAFGGGGHACAAAFSSPLPFDKLEREVIAAIGRRVEEVDAG